MVGWRYYIRKYPFPRGGVNYNEDWRACSLGVFSTTTDTPNDNDSFAFTLEYVIMDDTPPSLSITSWACLDHGTLGVAEKHWEMG